MTTEELKNAISNLEDSTKHKNYINYFCLEKGKICCA